MKKIWVLKIQWVLPDILIKNQSKNDLIYLKLGIGVPCAGQVKAILAPRVLVIVCESTLLANFGLVDPIGSNKI